MPPAEARPCLLILGGTTEARTLAARVEAGGAFRVVTSLAGRTRRPATMAGEIRSGGFGGAAGLAAFLRREAVDLVVDATHPFAAQISAHAAAACERAGVPRLVLVRPPWAQRPGDRWTVVPNRKAAAEVLAGLARRAFLAVGRRDLAAFADLTDIHFVVRLVDPPGEPLPLAEYEVLLGRGPFTLTEERWLLETYRIEAVVCRQSGGDSSYAKIDAAREAGIPVVLIDRPASPPGPAVATIDEALAWLEARPDQPPRRGRNRWT